MAISRREILGCAALAAGAILLAHDKAGMSLFRDPEAARRLGARYLALYREDNVRPLADALAAQTETGDPEALRQYLAALCRQDFAAGNTVMVDGWILARSEARACALVALEVIS